MLTPTQFLVVTFVVIIILLVFKIQQKRELANELARIFCHRHGIQLLDGTVAFRGLHIIRHGPRLVFRFQFSYSTERTDRHQGSISLVGNDVQNFYIDPAHLEDDARP